jgi:hypothetical protein
MPRKAACLSRYSIKKSTFSAVLHPRISSMFGDEFQADGGGASQHLHSPLYDAFRATASALLAQEMVTWRIRLCAADTGFFAPAKPDACSGSAARRCTAPSTGCFVPQPVGRIRSRLGYPKLRSGHSMRFNYPCCAWLASPAHDARRSARTHRGSV